MEDGIKMNIISAKQNFTLIVALLALGLVLFRAPPAPTAPAQKETAYQRVLRTRVLRCGYALWPTYEEMDPNTKQLKGMMPDFAQALAEKFNLKIEWTQEVIWGQEPASLNSGKIDAVCSVDGPWGYASGSVRDFTEPMAYVPIYLYGRKGETRFANLNDLNSPDVTFSAMDSDISLSVAAEKYPNARRLELPGSADSSLVVMNVLTGKADLVIEDAATADRVRSAQGDKLERLSPVPYAIINASFSVAKGEEDLLQMLNQGFQLLQQTGVSDAILDKYDPGHRIFYRPKKRWDTMLVSGR